MQSIYLLSRVFKFIINCSDCNWLQTALSNYSQTPPFLSFIIKSKTILRYFKKCDIITAVNYFPPGFFDIFKWLETWCLFHEKPGESKKKRERQRKKGVVLRV